MFPLTPSRWTNILTRINLLGPSNVSEICGCCDQEFCSTSKNLPEQSQLTPKNNVEATSFSDTDKVSLFDDHVCASAPVGSVCDPAIQSSQKCISQKTTGVRVCVRVCFECVFEQELQRILCPKIRTELMLMDPECDDKWSPSWSPNEILLTEDSQTSTHASGLLSCVLRSSSVVHCYYLHTPPCFVLEVPHRGYLTQTEYIQSIEQCLRSVVAPRVFEIHPTHMQFVPSEAQMLHGAVKSANFRHHDFVLLPLPLSVLFIKISSQFRRGSNQGVSNLDAASFTIFMQPASCGRVRSIFLFSLNNWKVGKQPLWCSGTIATCFLNRPWDRLSLVWCTDLNSSSWFLIVHGESRPSIMFPRRRQKWTEQERTTRS